jgi:hypothetical protein
MFLLSQLRFVEPTVENLVFFRVQKIGTEHWAVCDASNSNAKFTKGINNETLTLHP